MDAPTRGPLVAVALALLVITPEARQRPAVDRASASRSAPATPAFSARTSWGDPDLDGVWNYATMTPFERGRDVGGKDVLTEDEAAAYKRQTIARRATTVERFTRTSDDTLLYRFTVDDPTTWTRPWSAEVEMTRIPGAIYEYACHEGNERSVTGMLKGTLATSAEPM